MRTCVHYWVLGDGAANVPGRCKLCGVERVFRGMSGTEDHWGGDITTSAYALRDVEKVAASRARGGAVGGKAATAKARAKRAGTVAP